MKVLVAPNAMKGSIDAFRFGEAVRLGLSRAGIGDVVVVPIADGGDGTADVLANHYNAQWIPYKVLDPLNRSIDSGFYLTSNGIAIVEMAKASGLNLIYEKERDVLCATSFGTGQLIKSAIQNGAHHVFLCVGGSASVDAGMGALIALGCKFFSKDSLIEKGDGLSMGNVLSIDSSEAGQLLCGIEITIIVDVETPMLGADGAVHVFAPQKGASSREVQILSRNIGLFAGALFQTTGLDVSSVKGGGAAGAIAASFHALFSANIVNGTSFILNLLEIEELAKDCDCLITGEGMLDQQTLMGKAPVGILQIGTKIGKPVFIICGSNALNGAGGFAKVIELVDNETSREMAMANSFSQIEKKAEMLGRLVIQQKK
jgi:glycerate 2-kinase